MTLSSARHETQLELSQQSSVRQQEHESLVRKSPSISATNEIICQTCQERFHSRNALFRHLKSNRDSCGLLLPDSVPTIKQRLAIELSYYSKCISDPSNLHANTTTTESLAQRAGQRLHMAVDTALSQRFDNTTSTWIATTQASQARMRSPILSQEVTCAAATDIVVLTYDTDERIVRSVTEQSLFVQQVQDALHAMSNDDLVVHVQSVKWLDASVHLHAERSATQLVYHYILPLSWLPDSDRLTAWASTLELYPRTLRPAPPESLRRFKRILQAFQSQRLQASDNATEDTIRLTRRFGALAYHAPRAWHNFADPSLRGLASPNHQIVWRSVDQAHVIAFTGGRINPHNPTSMEPCAIVEWKGDAFLPQQIRRMVALAVALTHMDDDNVPFATWIQTWTRPQGLLPTPLAPAHRLYLAHVRFHTEERVHSPHSLFTTDSGGIVHRMYNATDALNSLHQGMLQAVSRSRQGENEWLDQLQHTEVPRLREHFFRSQTSTPTLLPQTLPLKSSLSENAHPDMQQSPAAAEYAKVQSMLHHLIETNQWPITSASRSAVLRRVESSSSSLVPGGSFTVINPQNSYYNNYYGTPAFPLYKLPLGNTLFPELVQAVFDLEVALSNGRPPSSHCAINANAQFTPHVDSGRGAGQSKSIIVGLGDYTGGELCVEDAVYDIRYQPIEFDGWKLRHWTHPFAGQRFSLVWFTPEMK
jgi:tRNA U38,U39,U40 pseudouridine synthase TruA